MEQDYCTKIGATGCYYLSICKAAELLRGREVDVVKNYVKLIKLGYMDWDCYVKDPAKIMDYLTGDKWDTTKESTEYRPYPEDVIIGRFERKTTMQTYGHFVLLDKNKHVVYDPLGTSKTVQDGKMVSLRVFRRKA
jgi:hypothetical protein